MTSRLEQLFAPEQLRQNWQQPFVPVILPVQNTVNDNIHAKYHELQRLIAEKYPDITRLAGRFEQLTAEINQAFPLDAIAPVDNLQKEAIVVMLEELEELLWAIQMRTEDFGEFVANRNPF